MCVGARKNSELYFVVVVVNYVPFALFGSHVHILLLKLKKTGLKACSIDFNYS